MAEPLEQTIKVTPEGADEAFSSLKRAATAYSARVGAAAETTEGLLGTIRSVATSGKAWLVGTLAAGVATVSAAIVTATAKAVGFENQLNEVRKTAGLTERQFQDLQSGLLEVQAELGTSQGELADIAAEAGRLGLEAPADIQEFTRVVALMSEATVVSADEAARGLARITNAFNMPISEAEALASVMNELSNQTVANTSDLVSFTRRAASTASQIGLTSEEVAALGATLIDAGFNARRAGTRMRVLFRRIQSNAEEVGKVMDLTAQQVVQRFEEDGVRALQALLSELEKLGPAARTAKIEELFSGRDVQTVQTLISQTENLQTQIDSAAQEVGEVDSLTEEFVATTKDVANEWNRLTGRLSAWVTDFGSNFTGILESALSTLNDLSGSAGEVARDTAEVLGRRERVGTAAALLEDLKEAERGTKEFNETLRELRQNVSDAFIEFDEQGRAAGVRVRQLEARIENLSQTVESDLADVQERALKELNQQFRELQFAQEQAEQAEPGSDAFIEAQKNAREARQEIERLAKAFRKTLPESSTEAQQLLAQNLDDFAGELRQRLEFTGFGRFDTIAERPDILFQNAFPWGPDGSTGPDGSGDDSNQQPSPEQQKRRREAAKDLRKIIRQVTELQERRAAITEEERRKIQEIQQTEERIEQLVGRKETLEAEMASASGDVAEQKQRQIEKAEELIEDERTHLEILKEERRAAREAAIPEEPPEAERVEAAPTGIADVPERLAGSDAATAMERINRITADYRETLQKLRLDLQRGAITQETFEQKSTQAAEKARKKMKELADVLARAGILSDELRDKLVGALEETEDEGENAKDETSDLVSRMNELASMAEGLSRIGEELGIISQRGSEAIQGISQVAQGYGNLSTAISDGNTFGAISAGTQLLGGVVQTMDNLIGSGSDMHDVNQQIRENTRDIAENTQAILEQGQIGEDVSEEQLEQAQQILDELREASASDDDDLFRSTLTELSQFDFISNQFRDLFNQLSDAFQTGISSVEYDSAAAKFVEESLMDFFTGAIDQEELASRLNEEFASLEMGQIQDILNNLPDDFRSVSDIIEQLREGLGEFSDSVSGATDSLDFMQQFGDTSTAENFQAFMDQLTSLDSITGNLRDQLEEAAGLDITTTEGRQRLQEIIASISSALSGGELDLGGLSPSEVEDILTSLQDFTEDQGDGSSPEQTRRRQTQVSRTLTETQANELIAIDMEQLFVLRGILDAVGGDIGETGFESMYARAEEPFALEIDEDVRAIRRAVVGGGGTSPGEDGSPGPVPTPPDTDPRAPRPSPGEGGDRIDIRVRAEETPESIARKLDQAVRESRRAQRSG